MARKSAAQGRKMPNKIYFYKMTTDSGGAPCVHKELLSLAICKPRIRKKADEGDLLFGFGGTELDGRLIYAAYVTEISKNGDYYREQRYSGRPDRIYRAVRGKARIRRDAMFHDDGDQLEHDVGSWFERADVLLSEDFRYFGANGTTKYREKFRSISHALDRLTQGHRVNHSASLRRELFQLAKTLWCGYRRRVNGPPSDADRTSRCNIEVGLGVC